MSHQEFLGQGEGNPDSGTLTLVRTVQPMDLETMQRIKASLPPDSDIMRRLHDPETHAFYDAQNNLVGISSIETRFFDEWEQHPHAIITETQVRAWSQQFYGRLVYYKTWFPRMATDEIGDYMLCRPSRRPPDNYICEGLSALSYLFADETYDTIKFRPVTDLDASVLKDYPRDAFKFGDTVCSFRDWKQGILLAMLRFGEIPKNHPSVQETVGKYACDLEFADRYVKEARHGYRLMIPTFRQFAKAWDVSLIPLRYFTCEAALGFTKEKYAYGSNDLGRFRTIFLRGGNLKHGRGLKLTLAGPAIVDKWNENGIRLSATAAAHHGYDAFHLKQVLGQRYKRLISVRP